MKKVVLVVVLVILKVIQMLNLHKMGKEVVFLNRKKALEEEFLLKMDFKSFYIVIF